MLVPDYATLKGDAPTHDADADPFDSGSGCTLDGIPIDCNAFASMVNNGAVSVGSAFGGKVFGDVARLGIGGAWIVKEMQIGPPDDPYTVYRDMWVPFGASSGVLGSSTRRWFFLPYQREPQTHGLTLSEGSQIDIKNVSREPSEVRAPLEDCLSLIKMSLYIHW